MSEWKLVNSNFQTEMMKDPFVSERAKEMEELAMYPLGYMEYCRTVRNSDLEHGYLIPVAHGKRKGFRIFV